MTDRSEPMETVESNSERANQMFGLLEKMDPALAQKTLTFLEGLPAQLAKGTESITDLGQKLKAKNELASAATFEGGDRVVLRGGISGVGVTR